MDRLFITACTWVHLPGMLQVQKQNNVSMQFLTDTNNFGLYGVGDC